MLRNILALLFLLHVTRLCASDNTRDFNSSNAFGDESYFYVPDLHIEDSDPMDDFESNTTTYFNHLQNFQQLTKDVIIYNSNRIDMYFSGSRQAQISSKSTYVDISLELIEEALRPFEYKLNFNTFFALPNTENKYKLVLESYNENDSIDSGSQQTRNAEGDKENQEVLLGVKYDALGDYFSNVNLEIGAKFAGIIPDAYGRVIARKSFVIDKYLELWLSNDMFYYALDRLDNKTEVRFSHVLYDDMKIELYNSYRIQEKDNDNNITTHQINNTISLSRLLSHQRGISVKAGIFSLRKDTEVYKLQYYISGVDFRQVVYKDWLYLEFNPAMMWREVNHYKMTFRAAFTFGIIFGTTQKYNDRAYRYSNPN